MRSPESARSAGSDSRRPRCARDSHARGPRSAQQVPCNELSPQRRQLAKQLAPHRNEHARKSIRSQAANRCLVTGGMQQGVHVMKQVERGELIVAHVPPGWMPRELQLGGDNASGNPLRNSLAARAAGSSASPRNPDGEQWQRRLVFGQEQRKH